MIWRSGYTAATDGFDASSDTCVGVAVAANALIEEKPRRLRAPTCLACAICEDTSRRFALTRAEELPLPIARSVCWLRSTTMKLCAVPLAELPPGAACAIGVQTLITKPVVTPTASPWLTSTETESWIWR